MLLRVIPPEPGVTVENLRANLTGRDFVVWGPDGEPEWDGGWLVVADAVPVHVGWVFERVDDPGCVDVVERHDPRVGGFTRGRITERVVQAKLGPLEAEYVRQRLKDASRWTCDRGTYYVIREHAPPPACDACEGGGKFFTVKGTEVACETCEGTGIQTETEEEYAYDEPSEFEDYYDPPGYREDW